MDKIQSKVNVLHHQAGLPAPEIAEAMELTVQEVEDALLSYPAWEQAFFEDLVKLDRV